MRSRFVSDWLLGLLALAATVAGVGLSVYLNRYHIQECLAQRERIADARRNSSHPITAELADEAVRAGDPIDPVITRHPPTHLLVHGRYTTAIYIEGNRETRLIARDGRLVFARLCGYHVRCCTFFSTLTPDDERDYLASYQQALAAARGAAKD